jgi:hypothetical protein
MSRARLNWVVGGGVGALLFIAGLDALRSSDSETSAPTATAATTTVTGGSALPACTREQITVSIDVLPFTDTSSGRTATIGVRSLNDSSCQLRGLPASVTIQDRMGNATFHAAEPSTRSGAVLPASGQTEPFPIPNDPSLCGQGGPYLALATLGPYSARSKLPGWRIGCPSVSESVTRLRAKYVARADAICAAATARFRAADLTASDEAAARASEEALAALRGLRPPRPDRALVNRVLSLMEQQTDVQRQVAAAVSAGEVEKGSKLGATRIRLTHRKDDLVYRLASLWGVSPDPLWGCPVALTA